MRYLLNLNQKQTTMKNLTMNNQNFEPLDATEMNWLAQHRFDLYYSLNVEEMYPKDQEIFRSISDKLQAADREK